MDETDPRPVVLALRALKLGDLLVAVPALHGLRRAFPSHRLLLATSGWLAPIVELVGVDGLVPAAGLDAPLPIAGPVEVGVNLHGRGPESGRLLAAARPEHLIAHAPDAPGGPDWIDGMHERERWARLVRAFGVPADPDDVAIRVPVRPPVVDRAVVVHVGAFYGARRWPADRFAEVARALADGGAEVVLTGSADDRARAESVAALAGLDPVHVLAGVGDLTDFAAVIAAASVVITADTGAAHLASAYQVPSVVLFGPAPPEEWGPPASGPHVVLTDARLRRGEVFSDEPDPALLAVTSDDVLEAVAGLPAR
jgi:ADP-heptose:LPS heptosyltransferase